MLKRSIQLFLAVLTFALLGTTPVSDLYRYPLGREFNVLSGTFGELRRNHFHSGIDIKTGGEEGRPLYAVREAYVYRLKVSPYGFGKAVYLRHPDGTFSVYAHMSRFNQEMEDFVYQKQYASKKYEQEIYLSKDRIAVKKGELIGYSGNSGSSMGPHLHFEIRDPDESIMNPLLEYRHLVSDQKKPIVQEIGFEAMDASSRVNGQFEKYKVVPTGSEGNYEVPGIVDVWGRVGVEYRAYDLLNGAGNHCGINYTRLFLDDTLVFEFALEKFSFDEKKNINVHFDYPYNKIFGGGKFEKAYKDNGNTFSAFKNMVNRGILELKDEGIHNFRLELGDSYQNTSVIRGRMRRKFKRNLPASFEYKGKTVMDSWVKRNVLVVRIKNPQPSQSDGLLVEYDDGRVEKLEPAYLQKPYLIFLLPLNKWKHPRMIQDPETGEKLTFNYRKTILREKNNIVDVGDLQLYFPYESVFDTLPLDVKVLPRESRTWSQVYKVGNSATPLYKSFVLQFKAEPQANPRHLVVARKNRYGRWNFVGRDIKEDGTVYASSSEFGEFAVMADSIPPRIKASNFSDGGTVKGKSLRIKVTDNFSGVVSDRLLLLLDGNWILGEFDAKTASVTYRWKDRPSPGKHVLELFAYDSADNERRESWTLNF